MPKNPITQVHLAVYHELMEWRREMWCKQNEDSDSAKFLNVDGEAWDRARLSKGDLDFVNKEVEKIINSVQPAKPADEQPNKPKVGFNHPKTKDEWNDQADLTE